MSSGGESRSPAAVLGELKRGCQRDSARGRGLGLRPPQQLLPEGFQAPSASLWTMFLYAAILKRKNKNYV